MRGPVAGGFGIAARSVVVSISAASAAGLVNERPFGPGPGLWLRGVDGVALVGVRAGP